MIISFSVPEMLPWILAGIPCECWVSDNRTSVGDWYKNIWQKQYAASEDDGRVKRQTIRRDSGERGRYGPMLIGHNLHLWWRSRTAERMKLAIMPCKVKQKIIIHDQNKVCIEGAQLKSHQIDSLAYADGFRCTDLFYEYFIAKGPFQGYLI